MTDSDLTLKVLVEMRDELRVLRDVRDDLRGFREETERNFSITNQRLEVLEHTMVGTNQRLEVIEHTLVDFGTQVVILGRYMKNSASTHGDEIADLRTRVAKLEAKD